MLSSFTKKGAAPARVTEAAAGLSARDVGYRLSKAVDAAHEGTGSYGYYKDHIGDDDSGDVIYYSGGTDMMCPYDFDGAGSLPILHMDDAKEVMSHTSYEPVPDDDSSEYTSQLEESFKAANLYTALPLYERFISKGERDNADSSDFAGKGKSFPILKKADVMAAVRSMGRAGSSNLSTDALKKNIIRIAKRKGWTDALPKSWQGGAKESQAGVSPKPVSRETRLTLVESAAVADSVVRVQEAASARRVPIKLIAPGAGSSAFYPAEVLKRDGPKVFKAGTHVYVNHPTPAEESARPEGDVNNLAGILMKDAEWRESHVHKGKEMGQGLYSEVQPFSDHASLFDEKGAFLGMSIRAFGAQESGKSHDGLPILKELVSAESVDVVTRAGAGGMILTEAARPPVVEDEMDAAEVKKLQESTARLLERALRSDAREAGLRLLASISLPQTAKLRVIESVIEAGLPKSGEELDATKFAEAINAAARKEGQYVAELTGSGRVVGMGAGVADADPAKIREAAALREAEAKRLDEDADKVFGDLMGNREAGKLAARKGEAA